MEEAWSGDEVWRAKIVAYADDYVICCRGNAEQAMAEMRRLMTQLKLTVNDIKTHIRRLPQERFAFLGYDFGRYYSGRTGRAYLCAQPSKQSVQRMIGKIREATERKILSGCRNDGKAAQSHVDRLGELLQPGTGPQGVSGDRSLHSASATPVAV
jgi:hypothetical protein